MFSSLASYLFGSNTTGTNSEAAETKTSGVEDIHDYEHSVDADNLIEVTSQTPSVTGVGDRGSSIGAAAVAASNSANKRGKNKRNNARQQNKRRGAKNNSPTKSGAQIACKQLTPGASCDEDFDEDEWYIVEKEDDFDVSPSRKDSKAKEDSALAIEIVKSVKPSGVVRNHLTQQRPLQHINSHSLYSGPRPQKQRNYLQKSRNNNNSNPNNNNNNTRLSVSTLSPSRTVNDGRPIGGAPSAGLTADGGMTRSLYAAPSVVTPKKVNNAAKGFEGLENGNVKKMDESWFVTPPPCFTSIGPINMETSPYENLLIEHPSMSVYHSIKTAQEAVECFVKLDLDVQEKKEERPAKENIPRKNPQPVQQRSSAGFRLDRQTVAQLKQELMARPVQKTQSKRERKDIRRSSINRANKARYVQSRNHTARRSDRQHCKVVSGANNNRKSCF